MTDAFGTDDVLGLAGTYPRPGWVILDAARDQRFTGELVIEARGEFRVYLDLGRVYLAERDTDPSLGARLVDAGAINAAQLEHGALRIGDHEHLGRLFDRVPSVDRQFVVIVTELMNEACVADIAAAQISTVLATPYRHHAAGVHHWDRPTDGRDLRPGDPLPAPESSDALVERTPPESLFNVASNDTDMLVHWNEPSWLDDARTPVRRPTPVDVGAGAGAESERESAGVSVLGDDWADHLESSGLPEPGDDPLARPKPLPAIATEQLDRFEVIWPSGDIDDDFDATIGDPMVDRDRVGPTARVARTGLSPTAAAQTEPSPTATPVHPTDPSMSTWASARVDDVAGTGDDPAMSDDVALSVRRAVASIDTGSLDARRRLADVQAAPVTTVDPDALSALEAPTVPRTTVVRPATNPTSVWSSHPHQRDGSPSVFDEPSVPSIGVAEIPEPVGDTTATVGSSAATDDIELIATDQPDATAAEPARVSALRRLIGGLRRR